MSRRRRAAVKEQEDDEDDNDVGHLLGGVSDDDAETLDGEEILVETDGQLAAGSTLGRFAETSMVADGILNRFRSTLVSSDNSFRSSLTSLRSFTTCVPIESTVFSRSTMRLVCFLVCNRSE